MRKQTSPFAHLAGKAARIRQEREKARQASQAKRRLSDEYDAAQARATVAGLGLSHKEIHEARLIRDADNIASLIVAAAECARAGGPELAAPTGIAAAIIKAGETRRGLSENE